MKYYERAKRSLVKTITYRILIIISTFIIVFISTGQLDLTIGITTGLSISSSILYFLHERIWNTIHWGKAH